MAGSEPPSTLSRIFLPLAQSAPVFNSTRVAEYPMLGQVAAYVVSPVSIVRADCAVAASFAVIFDLSKFGMAMAAMIRMIATTISNSIREKPFCFFMMLDLLESFLWCQSTPDYSACRTPLWVLPSGPLSVWYRDHI